MAYAAAAAAGGASTALLLVVASSMLPWHVRAPEHLVLISAVLGVIAILRDGGRLQSWVPENRRQVRQSVLDLSPTVGAAMFGFEMGTGARTYSPATTPHLVAVLAVIAGIAPASLVGAGLMFGAARGAVAVSRLASADASAWDDALVRMSAMIPSTASVIATALFVSYYGWLATR